MAKQDASAAAKPTIDLREQAERLVTTNRADIASMPPDTLQALVHELQVHQVELDMQNEELRRVQAELADARDRYFDLFELAPVGYLTLDANQRIEKANLMAAVMFGSDRRKLSRQSLSRLATAECRDDCSRALQRALQSTSREVCELSFLRGDRTYFVGRVEITPILSGPDRVTGFRVTITDITDRKRAEDALVEAKRGAEAANLAKRGFLAAMSHELRTPMSSILGMTELALQEAISPSVRDYLATAKESADNLLQLLDDLLDFSRIEAGKLTLEAAPFGPREMMGRLLENMALRAREKGLTLTCEVAEDVPDRLLGDALRLRQVLLNFVGNAIKFAARGNVVLRSAVRSRAEEAVWLEFSVSDTGIGIAPERQQEIFAPFTQVDASTARQYGGTGLGLAIASNLVTLMGGEIGVKSELGKGSTFFFTVKLPLAPPSDGKGEPVAVRPPPLHASPPRPLRILLAEDTRSNQRVIGTILERRGHAVQFAGDGREAVELAAREPFDVILMDVQMPTMDGLQATAAIRKDAIASRRVPIVALTAHAYKDDAEQCRAAGMDAFLIKPVKSDELIELVERLCDPAESGPEPWHPKRQAARSKPAASGLLAVFDFADALRQCLDDRQLLQDIVECLFKEAEPLVAQAKQALNAADADAMGRAAHRLKGTVSHLGAPAAMEALRAVEHMGFAGDLSSAAAAMSNLETQIKQLEQALATYRRKT
jgi:PAS domain S-box-containing protein